MALGAALFWGGSGVFAKIIATTGVSQITVICYRALFVSVVTGSFLYFKKREILLPGAALALYVLLGTFVMANGTGFMMACIYLDPSDIDDNLYLPHYYHVSQHDNNRREPKDDSGLRLFCCPLSVRRIYDRGELIRPISPVGVAWSLISVISLAGQTLISRRMSKSGELSRSHSSSTLICSAG